MSAAGCGDAAAVGLAAFLLAVCFWAGHGPRAVAAQPPAGYLEMDAEAVRDKVHGGLLGQLLGNLNGLRHEGKYRAEPGNVETYTPNLPAARTDDDTDIEWCHVIEIERSGTLLVPYPRLVELWKAHINKGIWRSNAWARALMDLGLEPPLTGDPRFNPHGAYNISGQFACESYGLLAPAMPRTAARTGVHYTHVSVSGEPVQATQLFAAMIAIAFGTDDLNRILDAGLAAVDPRSRVHGIVSSTRAWCAKHPDDWRATRRRILETYADSPGGEAADSPGGRCGYALNAACVVASLLYGKRDFAETLRLAFAMGWDADCNAATAGTVVGVIKGRAWIQAQGWTLGDAYRNTSRPGLPEDETITRFADRLFSAAQRAIVQEGGQVADQGGRRVLRIPVQRAVNVQPLPDPQAELKRLQESLRPRIEADLQDDSPARRARGAYSMLCLGLDKELVAQHPRQAARALADLRAALTGPTPVRGGKDLAAFVAERLARAEGGANAGT